MRARRSLLLLLGALALAGTTALCLRLRHEVQRALSEPGAESRPLTFVALAPPALVPRVWPGGDTTGLAAGPRGVVSVGDYGVVYGEQGFDVASGLPTERATAVTLWRDQLVVALAAGGVFRLNATQWEELRAGWGTLHVRTLAETEAGELLIGARQGLYSIGWGARTVTRLSPKPVRALAPGPGFILAGGEEGLWRITPGRVELVETPDPWIESLALDGQQLTIVTAAGVARGHLGGTLLPLAGGAAVASGVAHGRDFVGVQEPADRSLIIFDAKGAVRVELLPAPALRAFNAAGSLCADTEAGIVCREPSGWRLMRARSRSWLPGGAHVNALAVYGSRLAAGLFDGALLLSDTLADDLGWRPVSHPALWSINALLPAGGVLWSASLRGAARIDGEGVKALPGPGAAFSLASTPAGIVIGYGQGVLLPGARLLSAFHGLPGNQALALLPDDVLYVATPSGLGAIRQGRVAWRVSAGEGLPHPWVTALARFGDALYVATYGGGVAHLVDSQASGASGRRRFEALPETRGLKINPGCLIAAAGRLYLGTDDAGLWRASADGRRFERLRLALPSPRITALATQGTGATLWVGTDEGLARLDVSTIPD